jgi:Double-GTPase 2
MTSEIENGGQGSDEPVAGDAATEEPLENRADQPSSQPSVDEALGLEDGDDEFKPGDALTHEQAGVLCQEQRTTVVVLAGGNRSGKTTLLTSIYDHFNQEPVAGWSFAGSDTLFGFERRCHGTRQESGLQSAHTERSSRIQPPWLHLDLSRQDHPRDNSRRVLLADISGEWFEDLVRGTVKVVDLPHLWRADHVGIVLDGGKLALSSEVHTERVKAETLTRILIEQDAVVGPDALSIIVTKLDELVSEDNSAIDEIAGIGKRIGQVARLEGELPIWRTAAQPRKSAELSAGHGVVALFSSWLATPARTRGHASPGVQPAPTPFNDFPNPWHG